MKGQPRINWSQGEALEKLRTAVENWLSKSGELVSVDNNMTLHRGWAFPKLHLGTMSIRMCLSGASWGLMQANLAWWMETPNISWLMSSEDAIAETMVLVATRLWICFKT